MASGHSDYRKNIDIAQQSLSALSANVNIVAQTLDKMNVDIIAQTLAALKVDLSAQSIGNLDVDINAQSIGNVAMNIAGQTLSEVVQRNKYGAPQSAWCSAAFAVPGSSLLLEITGKGVIYGVFTLNATAAEPNNDYDYLVIDGVTVNSLVLSESKYIGDFTANPILPRVTLWDVPNGKFMFARGAGLTFESSFKMYYQRVEAGAALVLSYVYYALL